MKMTLLCFLVACGSELVDIDNSELSTSQQGLSDRLKAQMTDLTPATPGANAIPYDALITPEAGWDPAQFNPNRMVCLASSTMVTLMGYGDYDYVKQLLPADVEPLVLDFGLGRSGVPVLNTVSENFGWAGCTCPPKFDEYTIHVLVAPNSRGAVEVQTSEGTMYVAFLYLSTNHLKRQESLVNKFGLDSQFAGLPPVEGDESHIGILSDKRGFEGIYAKDQDGEIVFKAKRRLMHIPEPSFNVPFADALFYTPVKTFSFSGDKAYDLFKLDGSDLPGNFFRIQDRDHMMAFDPAGTPPLSALYVPFADDWKAAGEPGRILKKVKFKPVAWTSEEFSGAMAWIQRPVR